jgi:hypothetical protein
MAARGRPRSVQSRGRAAALKLTADIAARAAVQWRSPERRIFPLAGSCRPRAADSSSCLHRSGDVRQPFGPLRCRSPHIGGRDVCALPSRLIGDQADAATVPYRVRAAFESALNRSTPIGHEHARLPLRGHCSDRLSGPCTDDATTPDRGRSSGSRSKVSRGSGVIVSLGA